MSIKVSVVIGFKDWGLERLIGAVHSIRNSLGSIPSEVIISDYGSEDNQGYNEALSAAGALYHYISTDGIWSRSRALNEGLKHARGEFLITTDADMVFKPTTFPRLVDILENNSSDAFVLQCRDLPETITHEDVNGDKISWEQIDSLSRLRPRWGMGGLIAFHKDAYRELRGLDERMQIYGGEDLDLAKRLNRLGYKNVWINDPLIKMYHIWHESSREAADATPEGRAAIQLNRDIHMNDRSTVRNLTDWSGKPDGLDPLVTVAMSTFNRAEFLEDSIGSVIGQTFNDWELIIVNDGSTDDTAKVLEKFRDPRITVIHQENRGLAASRNRITSMARGKYIAVHDDDDIMLPNRLQDCLGAIKDGARGSYGGWVNFDNDTGEKQFNIGKRFALESLLFNGGVYLHPTLLIEKSVMQQIPYNESMRSGSDFNMAVRIARAGIKLGHCGKYVLLRRTHDGQITNSDSSLQKVAGVVSSFYGRGTMTSRDMNELRKDRTALDKVAFEGQKSAEPRISLFLPDHLMSRDVEVTLPLPTAEYEDLPLPLRGEPDAILANASDDGNTGIWRFEDLSLNDTFKIIGAFPNTTIVKKSSFRAPAEELSIPRSEAHAMQLNVQRDVFPLIESIDPGFYFAVIVEKVSKNSDSDFQIGYLPIAEGTLFEGERKIVTWAVYGCRSLWDASAVEDAVVKQVGSNIVDFATLEKVV